VNAALIIVLFVGLILMVGDGIKWFYRKVQMQMESLKNIVEKSKTNISVSVIIKHKMTTAEGYN